MPFDPAQDPMAGPQASADPQRMAMVNALRGQNASASMGTGMAQPGRMGINQGMAPRPMQMGGPMQGGPMGGRPMGGMSPGGMSPFVGKYGGGPMSWGPQGNPMGGSSNITVSPGAMQGPSGYDAMKGMALNNNASGQMGGMTPAGPPTGAAGPMPWGAPSGMPSQAPMSAGAPVQPGQAPGLMQGQATNSTAAPSPMNPGANASPFSRGVMAPGQIR